MIWVRLSVGALLAQKPERTLRHQAITGKIRVKKDGKYWLCDLLSLKEKGWITEEVLIEYRRKMSSLELSDITPPQEHLENGQNRNFTKKRKSYSIDVRDLGVYSELVELCTDPLIEEIKDRRLSEFYTEALYQLAFGYYEFHREYKLNYFREARKHLIKVIVLLHKKADKQNKVVAEVLNRSQSLLPGIGGLIRKTEKRLYERKSGTKGSFENGESHD